MRVRPALPSDRAKVIETVAAAFRHDPGWGWLLGDEYERVVGSFAGTLFDLRVVHGNVWVTEDLEAVAMWDAAGSDGQTQAEEVWARYRQAAGARVSERLDVYNDALAVASPADPYWYLGVLATHPARQGEGLASALLAPALDEADESQVACCLETSTEPNRRFYERRGFTESTEVLLADGPSTQWLRRPPSAPG
jgi:ribosomal protein S18 acetylase RimI-like enzyme